MRCEAGRICLFNLALQTELRQPRLVVPFRRVLAVGLSYPLTEVVGEECEYPLNDVVGE